VVSLTAPHVCGKSSSCPHTHHNIFNKGMLAVGFNNTRHPRAFALNMMEVIWPGQKGNMWIFGGDPCNLESDESYRRDAFVLEINIK
jgi:hypothetical protein